MISNEPDERKWERKQERSDCLLEYLSESARVA